MPIASLLLFFLFDDSEFKARETREIAQSQVLRFWGHRFSFPKKAIDRRPLGYQTYQIQITPRWPFLTDQSSTFIFFSILKIRPSGTSGISKESRSLVISRLKSNDHLTSKARLLKVHFSNGNDHALLGVRNGPSSTVKGVRITIQVARVLDWPPPDSTSLDLGRAYL